VLAGAPVVEAQVGLADQAGRRPAGILAADLDGQDRAGVEDLVEALVELEPLAVLDVDRPLLGPAGRLVADGQAQGQAAAEGVGVLGGDGGEGDRDPGPAGAAGSR
jgi:hypothetical protein